MVKGILADANIQGHVNYLVDLLHSPYWLDLWEELGLVYATFEDVGLDRAASDLDIWQRCQDEGYILITDNRNQEGLQSLEATIRSKAFEESLPVLTIGNVRRLQHDSEYAQAVATRLMGILIEIDAARGTGRLYLP